MSELPSIFTDRIKIGWKEYAVQIVPSFQTLIDGGKECYGQILYDKCLIQLNENNSDEQNMVTLIHEIIHGIEDMYALEVGEEKVERLANALYSLIKDNSQLIRGFSTPLIKN